MTQRAKLLSFSSDKFLSSLRGFTMSCRKIYIIPIILGIMYPVGFTLTYVLAAFVNKDIPAYFPYISDTGVFSIERCIFTVTLGFGALLMFVVVYIRCRQVEAVLKAEESLRPKLLIWNGISLYLAVLSAVCVFLTGCFQVVPFTAIHQTVANTAFCSGFVILIIQTCLSLKLCPPLGNAKLNLLRVIFLIVLGLAMVVTGLFSLLSLHVFSGKNSTQWTQKDEGFRFHLVSTFSEWILVLGIPIFFSLYAVEFKHLIVRIHIELDLEPV